MNISSVQDNFPDYTLIVYQDRGKAVVMLALSQQCVRSGHGQVGHTSASAAEIFYWWNNDCPLSLKSLGKYQTLEKIKFLSGQANCKQ